MKVRSVTIDTVIAMDDEWWKKMSSKDKSAYIREHPGSKYAQAYKGDTDSDKTKNPNFAAHIGSSVDALRKDWKERPVPVDEADVMLNLGNFLAKEKMKDHEMYDVQHALRKCFISAIILVKHTVGGIPRSAQDILAQKFIDSHLGVEEPGLKVESSADANMNDMIKELLKRVLTFVESNDELVQAEIKKARQTYGCPKCGSDSSAMFRCKDTELKCENGHVWHSVKDKKIEGYRDGRKE